MLILIQLFIIVIGKLNNFFSFSYVIAFSRKAPVPEKQSMLHSMWLCLIKTHSPKSMKTSPFGGTW